MAEDYEITTEGARFSLAKSPSGHLILERGATGERVVESFAAGSAGFFAAYRRLGELESAPSGASPARPSWAGDQPASVDPVFVAPGRPAGAGDPAAGTSPYLEIGDEAPVEDGSRAFLAPARRALPGAVVLAIGIGLGIWSLFGDYVGGSSIASQSDQLTSHAIELGAFTLSLLGLLSTTRVRAGAAFGVGVSVISFGLLLADVAQVAAGGLHVGGRGLVLASLSWIAMSAGVVLGATARTGGSPIGRPARRQPYLVGLALLLSLAVAGTFAPAWDVFHLHLSALGRITSVTAGNAFSNPGAVIAANVIVMALVVVVSVIAVAWSPLAAGGRMLLGACVPLVAQLVSAIVQAQHAPSPSAFGITAAQATQVGLRITSGLTAVFYAYCACTAVLVCFAVVTMRHAVAEPKATTSGLPPLPNFG